MKRSKNISKLLMLGSLSLITTTCNSWSFPDFSDIKSDIKKVTQQAQESYDSIKEQSEQLLNQAAEVQNDVQERMSQISTVAQDVQSASEGAQSRVIEMVQPHVNDVQDQAASLQEHATSKINQFMDHKQLMDHEPLGNPIIDAMTIKEEINVSENLGENENNFQPDDLISADSADGVTEGEGQELNEEQGSFIEDFKEIVHPVLRALLDIPAQMTAQEFLILLRDLEDKIQEFKAKNSFTDYNDNDVLVGNDNNDNNQVSEQSDSQVNEYSFADDFQPQGSDQANNQDELLVSSQDESLAQDSNVQDRTNDQPDASQNIDEAGGSSSYDFVSQNADDTSLARDEAQPEDESYFGNLFDGQ